MKALRYCILIVIFILALTMSVVYIAGEYTAGGFVKKFWYLYVAFLMLYGGYMALGISRKRKKL